MNHEEGLAWVSANHFGVLATIKQDGRPQLSNVGYTLDVDGLIRISTRRPLAKVHNVLRDPRVSLSVQAAGNAYLVVEGTARIEQHDVLPQLRRIYVRIAGKEHPDWEDFDRAMVRDQRVVLTIEIERLYPISD